MDQQDVFEIVVGVDGSENSRAAVRWAAEECAARKGHVTALMAWDYLDQTVWSGGKAFDPSYNENDALAALKRACEEAVGEVAATFGYRVENDRAAHAMIAASKEADLLVVGSRGLGGFQRLMLGSVAHQVVTHSSCPVTVVPLP